jgi:hypothetical protein
MLRYYFFFCLIVLIPSAHGQLLVARDTISVIENNYTLKMPWGNGLNYANLSSMDVNFDGKKDIVAFDRLNQFATGRFRCYINVGNAGQTSYSACPECSYYFPQVSNWAILRDYNCDGKEDIFCWTNAGIKVFKNVSVAPTLSFTLIKSLINTDVNPSGTPFLINLYASSNGLPAISDIDGDGDLDVLTFAPLGSTVQYHKNLSVETYGNCSSDSLIYELNDKCWGKFSEGGCLVVFNQSCEPVKGVMDSVAEKTYHSGATLMAFDSDGDGDKDVILGDIACNIAEYLHNTGSATSALMTDTTKLYPNFPNKNTTAQIKINNFPSAYYLDADGDNKSDLIVSPNSFGSENYKNIWLYKNTSSTNTVNFQFVKNNFLQDEMIEVGQNSYPVVFDYNADGKKDLLVGNFGYYVNNSLKAQLTLYENIGTLAQPAYSLITRDYAGISTYSLNNAMPTVGDVDNDGDTDILIGTSNGKIHWLQNAGGVGNPCNFSTLSLNAFSFTTFYSVAAPQLFDIDADGKLDLLIGNKDGGIAYYKNTGSGTPLVPSFSLITNFFGAVNVKGNSTLYGSDGYSAPYFYKDGSTVKLLVGSINGNIFHYVVSSNINTPFILINTTTNNFNEGGQSTICFEDINNDNKPDLLVGNASGGLSFFSSNSPLVNIHTIRQNDLAQNLSIYPNPSNAFLTFQIDNLSFDNAHISITDVLGKEILTSSGQSNVLTLSIESLNKGIYFAKVTVTSKSQHTNATKKIIKN